MFDPDYADHQFIDKDLTVLLAQHVSQHVYSHPDTIWTLSYMARCLTLYFQMDITTLCIEPYCIIIYCKTYSTYKNTISTDPIDPLNQHDTQNTHTHIHNSTKSCGDNLHICSHIHAYTTYSALTQEICFLYCMPPIYSRICAKVRIAFSLAASRGPYLIM